MAPHKQPKSLLDLARNEVGKLVLNRCINIDIRYSYNEPSWHNEVDSLQALLVEHIPASEWDTMCEVVFRGASQDSVKMKDSRVIYATLVHRNMKKLVVKPLCELTKSCRFYSQSIEPLLEDDVIHRDFWLHLIGKLVNIVDLDMLGIDCDKIYATIGENLKNLERLVHGSLSLNFVPLLKTCSKLRVLQLHGNFDQTQNFLRAQGKKALEMFPDLEDFDYPYMDGVFETLDISRPLKLSRFPTVIRTPLDISPMIPLCPNLTALTIDLDSIESSVGLFTVLATSMLQLTHLSIVNYKFVQNIENFLKVKGIFINSLTMHFYEADPGILLFALHCSNVSSLTMYDNRSNIQDNQNQIINGMCSCFKHLKIFEYYGREINSLKVPEVILSRSSALLSSLEIGMPMHADDKIMSILNASRLTEIKRLVLSDCATSRLLHYVYTNCPKLTSLTVQNDMVMDAETIHCINFIRCQVLEKNLDLDIVVEFRY